MIGSVSAGMPDMCATTIALVRGVIRAAIWSAPALYDPGAASATTGMQPIIGTGIAPPGSVTGGRITSLSGSGSSARSATYTALVPELTASANPSGAPRAAQNSSQ